MKYKIQKNGNVLNVEFGEKTNGNVGTLAQVTAEKIDKMKSDNKLVAGRTLKIYGDIPKSVIAVIAHKVSHMFVTVAVYEPEIEKYVVTAVHDSKYSVGDIIE